MHSLMAFFLLMTTLKAAVASFQSCQRWTWLNLFVCVWKHVTHEGRMKKHINGGACVRASVCGSGGCRGGGALTASDSASFQSACIRFITFLSLRLVDAPRVPLQGSGRRRRPRRWLRHPSWCIIFTLNLPGGDGVHRRSVSSGFAPNM